MSTNSDKWLPKLSKLHSLMTERFHSSLQYRLLESFVNDWLVPAPLHLSHALCVGLSSFCMPDYNAPVPYSHSLNRIGQLVFFESLLSLLASTSPALSLPCNIYFQDSVLTKADKLFLRERGYVVTEDLKEYMTETVFFFNVLGNNRWILRDFLRHAYPALLVGHSIEYEDHHQFAAPSDSKDAVWRVLANPIKLVLLKGLQRERAIDRRRLIRPFQSKRIWRPIFYRERPWMLAGSRTERERGLQFLWEMWAYWRPQDDNDIHEWGVEEEIPCECFICRGALLENEDMSMRIDQV